MGKVFVDIGVSVDGFMAGDNRGARNPLGDGGIAIHEWMFKQNAFRKHLGMDGGESDNTDNEIIEKLFNRIGANIMGKRMFEEGEANWPEKAPFGTPVFVLSHASRKPWERPGGTVFYFTDDPIEAVLKKARAAAGEKDVRISGGANVIQQFLNAGLVDECTLHIAPRIIGRGIRAFDNIHPGRLSFEIANMVTSPFATHITYRVSGN
jgi:dihydrofolate reductase